MSPSNAAISSTQRGGRACALLLGLTANGPLLAHDFWLQPAEFWVEAAAETPLTLQVGDAPTAQRSSIPGHRIVRFDAIGPGAEVADLRSQLRVGSQAADAWLRFDEPGAHVVVLESDNRARSYLPADRFNEYLHTEGLTPALEHRRRTASTHVDGMEKYSRHTKLIVQVGRPGAAQSTHVTTSYGLMLEIVPEVNPYAEPRPALFPVQVVYEGQALPGAQVQLIDLEQELTPVQTHVTDQQGRAKFSMPTCGSWIVSVVWTKPLPSSDEVDFETTFSTLSFGFPAARFHGDARKGNSVRECALPSGLAALSAHLNSPATSNER